MKKAFLAVAMLVSAAALLLAVSCRDDSGVSGKSENGGIIEPNFAPVSNGEVETLCRYFPRLGFEEPVAFQSDAQITEHLERTGYYENDTGSTGFKKMAHQPDTQKWTYFAFLVGWSRDIRNVAYGEDTVIVQYIVNRPPPCIEPPCPVYTMPGLSTTIYFIPFIGNKAVKFEEVEPPTND
jgi:hypothetical protein